MTISKPYLTFVISLILGSFGSIIAYLTNWMIIIPVLFAIGIPLVNIDKPLRQKTGLIIATVLVSTVIFIATVFAALSFEFDKYILPGLLVGMAGMAILGINGFLIETVKLNLKTITLTFLLSGFSLPIWVLLTENIFPKAITNIELVRQYGVMLFWMTLTTIGICLSIEPKAGSARSMEKKEKEPTANST